MGIEREVVEVDAVYWCSEVKCGRGSMVPRSILYWMLMVVRSVRSGLLLCLTYDQPPGPNCWRGWPKPGCTPVLHGLFPAPNRRMLDMLFWSRLDVISGPSDRTRGAHGSTGWLEAHGSTVPREFLLRALLAELTRAWPPGMPLTGEAMLPVGRSAGNDEVPESPSENLEAV